jgi:hypothetical protein
MGAVFCNFHRKEYGNGNLEKLVRHHPNQVIKGNINSEERYQEGTSTLVCIPRATIRKQQTNPNT